jgi:polyisoprenyl-teichoic acid--peptidoglycan teichoic acid transferase
MAADARTPNSMPPPSTPRRRVRPLAAATLSALLPGAGQYAARRPGRAAIFLAVSALLTGTLLAVGWGAATGLAPELLGLLLQPQGLLVVMAVNVGLAVFRLVATLDAWQAARNPATTTGPVQALGLLLLVAVVVVGPHAAVGAAGAEGKRVVDAVFVPAEDDDHADDHADPDPSGPTAHAEEPAQDGEPGTLDPNATPDLEDPPNLVASDDVTGPALEPESPPTDREPFADVGRLTVLLLGSDAGHDRTGTRIDALVVASVDVASGRSALISVPRNLAEVPMPAGVFAERLGDNYRPRLMSLYPEAAGDPVLGERFADPGKEAHVAAVETLLDLPIDHVAMVDMAGFVDVIDAFGGVDVDVSERLHVRLSPPQEGEDWRTYDIPAGRQRLDGHEAHAYVRSRTGTDDYDRMRRQRCLLGSLTTGVDTLSLVRALPRLTDVLVDHVATDIPVDLLPDLARLTSRVDVGEIRTLGITPPTYTTGRNPDGFLTPDLPKIRAAVHDLLERPAQAAPAGASDLGGTCG